MDSNFDIPEHTNWLDTPLSKLGVVGPALEEKEQTSSHQHQFPKGAGKPLSNY